MKTDFPKRPLARMLLAVAVAAGASVPPAAGQSSVDRIPGLAIPDLALQWNMLGAQVIVVGDTNHGDSAQYEGFVRTLLDDAQQAGVKYIAIEQEPEDQIYIDRLAMETRQPGKGMDKDRFLDLMNKYGEEYVKQIDRNRELNTMADLVIGATRRGMKVLCVDGEDSSYPYPSRSPAFLREAVKYTKQQAAEGRTESRSQEFLFEFMNNVWPKQNPKDEADYQAEFAKYLLGRQSFKANKSIFDRAVAAVREDQAKQGEPADAPLPKLMIRYGAAHEIRMVSAAAREGYKAYAFNTFSTEAAYRREVEGQRRYNMLPHDHPPGDNYVETGDSLVLATRKLHAAAPVPPVEYVAIRQP